MAAQRRRIRRLWWRGVARYFVGSEVSKAMSVLKCAPAAQLSRSALTRLNRSTDSGTQLAEVSAQPPRSGATLGDGCLFFGVALVIDSRIEIVAGGA